MEHLTPRQRQICELTAIGKGSKAIGRELGISARTVEDHKTDAYRKLGVDSAIGLIWKLLGAEDEQSRLVSLRFASSGDSSRAVGLDQA